MRVCACVCVCNGVVQPFVAITKGPNESFVHVSAVSDDFGRDAADKTLWTERTARTKGKQLCFTLSLSLSLSHSLPLSPPLCSSLSSHSSPLLSLCPSTVSLSSSFLLIFFIWLRRLCLCISVFPSFLFHSPSLPPAFSFCSLFFKWCILQRLVVSGLFTKEGKSRFLFLSYFLFSFFSLPAV